MKSNEMEETWNLILLGIKKELQFGPNIWMKSNEMDGK